MKTAIYPGTFDPITNGHLDIIKRALSLFDKVVVAIARNEEKGPKYCIEKRLEMAKACTKELKGVEVKSFNSLLVDFADEQNADVIVRGLRAVSDFEYELQLGYANASLNPRIETIYLMPTLQNAFISSSIVRSVLKYDINKAETMLPAEVHNYIKEEC